MFTSCDASRFARDLAMTWFAGESVTKVQHSRGKNISRDKGGKRGDRQMLWPVEASVMWPVRRVGATRQASALRYFTERSVSRATPLVSSWGIDKGRQSSEETLCVAKYGAKMLHRDVISSGDVKWRVWCYRMTCLGHGSEEAMFEAFPRLLRQRGDFLWMQHVLQVMHEMQATRNFWECHMLEVEGDVRKCAPGIWSD